MMRVQAIAVACIASAADLRREDTFSATLHTAFCILSVLLCLHQAVSLYDCASAATKY